MFGLVEMMNWLVFSTTMSIGEDIIMFYVQINRKCEQFYHFSKTSKII
jgi:hypothetical protein